MRAGQRVLGIDLGIASCGWGVIEVAHREGAIVAAGVRCFDAPLVDKTGEPKSAARRLARGQRRVTRRRRQRMKAVRALLHRNGLLPDTADDALAQALGRHTPSGLLLPFHRHHRQGAIAKLQVSTKDSLKKRLWQKVIRRKILNQAAALVSLGKDDGATLKEIARHVEPGDPDNVEARAARFYWPRLFADFVRDDPADRRNKLLNYGYAVVRAGVARGLAAAGLVPALGLAHEGAANAFNLADDLFEPFRPFVDLLAWRTSANGAEKDGELTVTDRRAMAGALLIDCRTGNDRVNLLVAAETAAQSLVRAFEDEKADRIVLPELEAAA